MVWSRLAQSLSLSPSHASLSTFLPLLSNQTTTANSLRLCPSLALSRAPLPMPRSTSTSPQSSAYNPYGNNHSYPPAPYGDPRSLPSTNPPGWLSTTSGPPPQVIETKTRSGLRNRNATESASSQPLPSPGLAGPSGGAKANTPSEFVKKLFR
jgi:hypothetical protein